MLSNAQSGGNLADFGTGPKTRVPYTASRIKEDRLNAFHPSLWWAARTRWQQVALVVWCGVLTFVCTRVWLRPTERTVYPIFSGSAQLWWQGQDLYEPGRPDTVQGGYRYSPAFAALMMPLAMVPDSVGGAIWRMVNVAAFLAALAWFAQAVLPWRLSRDEFAWLTLLCLPLSVQSINNGQANMLVITTMLAAMSRRRRIPPE